MNEMEEQLSRLFHATVGEPPREVTFRAVRRQATRRRVASTIAVAASLAVVGSVGATVAANAAGPKPSVTSAEHRAAPRFYIVTNEGKAGTQVRATSTGAVTATVHCPWAGSTPSSMTAQANNRTFMMVCEKFATGRKIVGARIFRFRLTNSGKIPGYAAVRGGKLSGDYAGRIATTPDGSLVAVDVVPGTPHATGSIVVIKTKTGSHVSWQGSILPGSIRFSGGELSFGDNGKVLAVFGRARCIKGATSCKSPGEEMLALSPAAKGGQLSSGRVVFRQGQVGPPSRTFINDAYLSSDGSTVTLSRLGDGGPPDSVSVVQLSAATGRPLRTLFKLITGNGFFYRFVSTDQTGRFVLFNAGPTRGTVFGWMDNGKLVKLKPAGTGVSDGAW